MLEHLKSFDWWFSAIIVGIIVGVLGNLLFFLLHSFFSSVSETAKIKGQKRQETENNIIRYYSSNFNLLVVRQLWSTRIQSILIIVTGVSNLLILYALFIEAHAQNLMSLFLASLSLLLMIIFVIILKKSYKELKRINNASLLHIEDYTIGKYFHGKWNLTFSKPDFHDKEIVEIRDGYKYFGNGKLLFYIRDFKTSIDGNQISFEKHRPEGSLHSKETLRIQENGSLTGNDTIGFNLVYEKI
jgi:hypothetical protein